ncbi:MAG TPA: phage protein Gp27 family protein [Candidatus Binataceae bacterium]|nr:phage protein Gp27 family protein [Candidatus Binataceae bacterium]
MTSRSKVLKLPAKLRDELDHRIVAGHFSNYAGLARWLERNGCEIGTRVLQAYGQGLERRLEAVRLATVQARAVVAATDGEDDMVSQALMRLVQADLFKVLVELKETNLKDVDLTALARHVAGMGRAVIEMRRLTEAMREGVGKRVQSARRRVAKAVRLDAGGGLSPAAALEIRKALLAITQAPELSASVEQLPEPLAAVLASSEKGPPRTGNSPEKIASGIGQATDGENGSGGAPGER